MDTCGSGWCSLYYQFTDISSIECWRICLHHYASKWVSTFHKLTLLLPALISCITQLRENKIPNFYHLPQTNVANPVKDTKVGRWKASTQLSDQCVSQLAINAYSSETKKTFAELFFFCGNENSEGNNKKEHFIFFWPCIFV